MPENTCGYNRFRIYTTPTAPDSFLMQAPATVLRHGAGYRSRWRGLHRCVFSAKWHYEERLMVLTLWTGGCVHDVPSALAVVDCGPRGRCAYQRCAASRVPADSGGRGADRVEVGRSRDVARDPAELPWRSAHGSGRHGPDGVSRATENARGVHQRPAR